jgi:hypothetical protein
MEVQEYIQKPIAPSELIRLVDNLLGLRNHA